MNNTYKFELMPLPYGENALEPYITALTLSFHHGKHLQTYIDNLNKALADYPQLQGYTLEKLLYNINDVPEAVRTMVKNNGGGVYNHNLYFELMAPNSQGPKGELLKAIEGIFGSVDNMLAQLRTAATTVFGSGWAWLVTDKNGNLKIVKSANQDTFIPENLFPVLIVDVWEHAYYLQYQNRRPEYLEKWVNVINWEKAEEFYALRNSLDYSKL